MNVAVPVNDERASLLRFLDAQRQAALAILAGLDDEQGSQSITPSGWTPQSMAVHLGDVERHWFAFALGGDHARSPALSRNARLSEAITECRAEIARSNRLLAGCGLDDPPAQIPEELPGEIHTVRDVIRHVIEEIARHNGHLDIARELIDGRTGLGPR